MEDKMAGAAFGRATNYGPTLEWRSKVNKIYIKKGYNQVNGKCKCNVNSL